MLRCIAKSLEFSPSHTASTQFVNILETFNAYPSTEFIRQISAPFDVLVKGKLMYIALLSRSFVTHVRYQCVIMHKVDTYKDRF